MVTCVVCEQPADERNFAFAGYLPRLFFCDEHWASRGEEWWFATLPWRDDGTVVLRLRDEPFPACPARRDATIVYR